MNGPLFSSEFSPATGFASDPAVVSDRISVGGLDDAYAECGRIVRASGSSFYQAFRLLPLERRRSLEALYAFCRVVDDAADEGTGGVAALAWWRGELGRVLAGTATHAVGRSADIGRQL